MFGKDILDKSNRRNPPAHTNEGEDIANFVIDRHGSRKEGKSAVQSESHHDLFKANLEP